MKSFRYGCAVVFTLCTYLSIVADAQIDYSYFGILEKAAKERLRTEPLRYFHLDKVKPELEELPSVLSDIYPALPTDASELCFNQTVHWFENLSQQWAIRMLDASAHLPSGVLEGDFIWTGDYDECVATQSGGAGNMDFMGKFCRVTLPANIGNYPISLVLAACVPSGCHAEDVHGLIDSAPVIIATLFGMNLTNVTSDISVVCEEPDSLDTKAVVTIVILAIFGVLMAAGTLYDIGRKYYLTFTATGVDSKSGILGNGYQEVKAPSEISSEATLSETTPLLNEKREQPEHVEPGLVGKLLLCFSLYTNTKKIMNTTQAKGSLTCIHGIRFFSITWVVLGHSLAFMQIFIKNKLWVGELTKRWTFSSILNATVSVDSFFVMSGLLLTYLTLRELEKRKGKLGAKGWVMIYVHRYIRLTPVYMLLLMFWSALQSHLGNGPYWPQGSFDKNCAKSWWINLLYLNNLVDLDTECFGWSWYLANDMQFFIIAIPMIYLLYRYRAVGLAVLGTLTTGSMMAAMITAGTEGFTMLKGQGKDYMYHYYVAPWCRFQTYGVGMLAGYFLHTQKCKLKVHWFVNLVLWAIAAALCILPLYGPHAVQVGDTPDSQAAGTFYNGLSRTSWGVGLSWVIIACVTNNGGLINEFLSWKAFVPLGRLAYCVYLTNLMALYFYLYYARQLVVMNDLYLAVYFVGILVFNYAWGFAASVTWEAPTMALEKLIFKR